MPDYQTIPNDLNILVIDDDPVSAKSLLKSARIRYVKTIATANTIADSKEILARQQIDVILTDLIMNNQNEGLEFCRWAKEKYPATKIIVVSVTEDIDIIAILKKLNIEGLLAKKDVAEVNKLVATAIKAVAKGDYFYSPLMQRIIDNLGYYAIQNQPDLGLSREEKSIIYWVHQGLTSAVISDTYSFASARNVDNIVGRIMVRLQVNKRSLLFAEAVRLGLMASDYKPKV